MGSKQLKLQLLGNAAMNWQGQQIDLPPPKQFALLCYLAIKDVQVSREELAAVLWGEGKSSAVRHALHHLKTLPHADEWLETTEKAVTLHCTCDVTAFDQSADAKKYCEAVDLWNNKQDNHQGLLPLFRVRHAPDFSEWLDEQRQRLINRYFGTIESCIESKMLIGANELALEYAYKWLNFDSASEKIIGVNEVAYQYVIDLEYRCGHSDNAMASFQELKQRLANEELEPSQTILELIKQIEAESIKAGTKALLLDETTDPPSLPEVFVGRDHAIAELKASLKEHKSVLLQGFGGIGKTTLAASFAQTCIKEAQAIKTNKPKAIWLDAGEESFESCAEAIISACFADDAKKAKSTSLLQALKEKNINLIVLDDISNAVTLDKFQANLKEVDNLQLLATSRIRFRKIAHLELAGLERQDSLKLLAHHAGKLSKTKDIENQICERLVDHPFAVRIAGITLKQTQVDAKQLLQNLEEQPHNLDELSQSGPINIEELLQFSLDYCSDEEYEGFFAYSALFQASVTPELLSLCLRRPEGETEEALFGLHRRGLVQRQLLEGSDLISYTMHDLAFSFTKTKGLLRATSTWKAVPEYLDRHLDKVEFVEAEFGNVLGAAQLAPDNSRVEIMELLALKGQYFNARGHNSLSIKLLGEAAQLAEELESHEIAMNLYGKLADAHINSYGDYKAAVPVIKQALDIAETIENKQKEALYCNMYGIAKLTIGEESGENDLGRALKLARETDDLQCLGTVLGQQGFIYGQLKDFKKANISLKEALNTLRAFKQNNIHSDEFERREYFAILNLAVSELDLGSFDTALDYNREALNIAEVKSNEIWIAYSCNNIGEIYISLKDLKQARMYLFRALELYEKNNMISEVKKLLNYSKENRLNLEVEFEDNIRLVNI